MEFQLPVSLAIGGLILMRITLALATVAFSTVAFSQITGLDNDHPLIPASFGTFQVAYASNLNIGDSFVNITNSGAALGLNLAILASQNICVSLYTFDPAEELISCCTCTVTPNGLQSLSVLKSLISNPLTPAIPTSVVIKALATYDGICNAATPIGLPAIGTMLAWGTTLHQNTSTAAASYSVTERPFSNADLSLAEAAHIASTCGFIQADGSGFGICKGCSAGGLGASTSNQ